MRNGMREKNKSQGYGMNFLEVLLIVFVILRLVGVISWSWWWVLSPLWLPLLIVMPYLVYAILKRL